MEDSKLAQRLAAVASRVVPGGKLLSHWPLKGGVSADVEALKIGLEDGRSCRVVVRRHGAAEWKQLDANVTQAEFSLLLTLRRAGLPVPKPRFLDLSGELLPSPYFVMNYVEGDSDVPRATLPTALRQMAAFLARLHALKLHEIELPPFSQTPEDPFAGALEYLPAIPSNEGLRNHLSNAAGAHSGNAQVLLHGDYWPGNILWHEQSIAAVIDWEDASVGDPLSDLAGARCELLCKYGESAMESFTADYVSMAKIDTTLLPVWELYASSAALATMADWGLPPNDEAHRRGKTRWFMEQAVGGFEGLSLSVSS